uniref:leucine--tRNA ligase n=2 Tax=Lygus hesperus TaxID=30085 RepID=A0A0K8SRU4_LYGHE
MEILSVSVCRIRLGSRVVSSPKIGIYRRHSSVSKKSSLDLATKLKIESKWGSLINQAVNFDETSKSEKCYICPMFPYPSGNLHMGHVRVYTISDAIARFQRQNGKNVLHPIGFDSFGLPAENAAIENQVQPEEWTNKNIAKMRKQLRQLGCSFDWSREVITSDPQYYKFTQYIFLLMYKHGLVYRKKAWVNWDPVDKTVLADEQVDSNGRSWRSGAKVERKQLEQWFIRSTNFAQSLRNGLDNEELAEWRDIVKLQKHWIGECDGAEFIFPICLNGKKHSSLNIWVQKPEHISKAAFVAVSDPSEIGIPGSVDSNVTVINPFTKSVLPVIVIPHNDLNYPEGCSIKLGIPSQCDDDARIATMKKIPFDSTRALDNFDERIRVCQLAVSGKMGGHLKSSRLRDWLVSRQRRWGTPIPVVHCDACGTVPVAFKDLPVVLPKDQSSAPSAKCPKCGEPGRQETDTMDTFVDSAWYFLRYIDPTNQDLPFDKNKVENMMPVDVYIGGKEHATLHLYYARFLSHFLHSIGWIPDPEPFKRLLVQGMVMGKTYYIKKTKQVVRSSSVIERDGQLVERESGEPVFVKWEKMSKSKHNGVEPSDMFDKFGVDTTRLLILGEVAPTSDRLWKEEAFDGILNFQEKVWTLLDDFMDSKVKFHNQSVDESKIKAVEDKLRDARNFHVKGVTFNYNQSYQLSVAISKLQSLVKSLKKFDQETMAQSLEFEKALAALLIMLAPMAPHFASELWFRFQMAPRSLQSPMTIQWKNNIFKQSWPQMDDDYLLDVIFKVNNAVKGDAKIQYKDFKKLNDEVALKMALSDPKVVDFLGGRDILAADCAIINGYSATLNIKVDHTLHKQKGAVRKNTASSRR